MVLCFIPTNTKTMKFTRNLIGDRLFDKTARIYQCSSTSCSLFTFYINLTICKIAGLGDDGFW